MAQLNDLENWLYEEGEDCEREIYTSRLSSLKQQTDPIKNRSHDYEQCPAAFDELKNSIAFARQAVAEFRKGVPKYDHLTETEFINIAETADKAQKWLDANLSKFTQSPRTSDSPVQLAAVRQETHTLTTCVNSVINRAKPKPAAKASPPKDTGSAEQNGGEPTPSADKMDVDGNAQSTASDPAMDVEWAVCPAASSAVMDIFKSILMVLANDKQDKINNNKNNNNGISEINSMYTKTNMMKQQQFVYALLLFLDTTRICKQKMKTVNRIKGNYMYKRIKQTIWWLSAPDDEWQ